jgi:hypothetical protein
LVHRNVIRTIAFASSHMQKTPDFQRLDPLNKYQ